MAISDGVVYWYVPMAEKATEIQISLLLYVAFLGMTSWDLAKSLVFDLKLLVSTFRGPHWRDPVRFLSRTCYFITRFTGFIGNLLPTLYITTTQANCHKWKYFMLTPAMLCNTAFSAVFACRAYVVSRRNKWWGAFFLLYLSGLTAFGFYVYFNFGTPFRVPNSKFCVWIPPERGTKFVNLDHVYIALTCLYDFIVLIVTLHSLVEGGLPHILRNSGTFVRNAFGFHRDNDDRLAWGALSQHLIEQGVALYATFELLRLVCIIAMIVLPDYVMPVFIRSAFQNGLNPIIVRMLLQGQARYLRMLPVSRPAAPLQPLSVNADSDKTLEEGDGGMLRYSSSTKRRSIPLVPPPPPPKAAFVDESSSTNLVETMWLSTVPRRDKRTCGDTTSHAGGGGADATDHGNDGNASRNDSHTYLTPRMLESSSSFGDHGTGKGPLGPL